MLKQQKKEMQVLCTDCLLECSFFYEIDFTKILGRNKSHYNFSKQKPVKFKLMHIPIEPWGRGWEV